MGKYVEDARVVSFSADTLITHDTYLNEQQDQIRGFAKARRLDGTSLFVPEGFAGWTHQHTGAAGLDWYWVSPTPAANERMIAHLPLREGEKIVDIDVIYQDSNNNGGEIALYSKQRIAVGSSASLNASVKVADLGVTAANPWNQGGANYHRKRTTINTVVAADYQYSVWVQAASHAGNDIFIALIINPQFGN